MSVSATVIRQATHMLVPGGFYSNSGGGHSFTVGL